MKSCVLFSLSALLSIGGISQTITLENVQNGAPIMDVFVFNKSGDITTFSNSTGVVNLSKFQKKDTILFQHPSFEMVRYSIQQARQLAVIAMNPRVTPIREFVYVSRRPEEALTTPIKVHTIKSDYIKNTPVSTVPELLQSSGKVSVQRSQLGGGSPIIRGFEANRVLLMVDGVRMNNAIYRSGHLQNSLTIDDAALESVEIGFGPSSSVYGSDALGGVIHFFTKKPQFSKDSSSFTKTSFMARYGTAAREKTGNLNLELGGKKVASFTSISGSAFEDLRMGARKLKNYQDFGKVYKYTERINNQDIAKTNLDPNLQRGTGYDQLDILQKFRFQLSKASEVGVNLQYSTSTNIPRFDRLNDVTNGIPRFAEWYYGPQERLLVSSTYDLKKRAPIFDDFNLTMAYQSIEESRINRRFGNDIRFTNLEQLQAYTASAIFGKTVNKLDITYGVDGWFNELQSVGLTQDITSSTKVLNPSRYPDGDNEMFSLAAFAQVKKRWGEKLFTTAGSRYTYTSARSTLATNIYALPFNEINIANAAPSGNLGIVYLHPGLRLRGTLASGFRTPNIDDYGKIFDQDEFIIAPNQGLSPEYVYSADIGATKYLAGRKIAISIDVFYSHLTQFLSRQSDKINGDDSLSYQGERFKIQSNQNTDLGRIYGGSAGLQIEPNLHWTIKGNMSYTLGDNLTNRTPLPHIPPLFGNAEVKYQQKSYYLRAYSFYNGWKYILDYAPAGSADNEDEATPDGTPAWFTLNAQFGLELNQNLNFSVAVENIADQHYKPFASGMSAPGRNVILTLRVSL